MTCSASFLFVALFTDNLSCLFFREFHCYTIHAITQSSGFWTVIEDVAKVTTTDVTKNLCTYHPVAFIAVFFQCIFGNGRVKARPARSRIKFRIRREQRVLTGCAGKKHRDRECHSADW